MTGEKVVNKPLGDRVRAAREACVGPDGKAMTQEELGLKVGLSQTAIAGIENGLVRHPRKLQEIATATNRSYRWLLTGDEDSETSPGTGVVEVTVVGVTKAGVFQAVEEFDFLEPAKLQVAADPRFPNAKMVAFSVEGDSMTEEMIMPGDYVICVDFADSGLPLRDKMIVVVQRTRDGGQSFERTVKQVRVYRDRYELVPRSKNPAYKPVVIPIENSTKDVDGYEVTVVAIVIRVTKEIPV